MNESIINLAASLVALCGVLLLAYFVIKGGAKLSMAKSRSGLARVIEVTSLGGRDRLVVVSYDQHNYLLSVSTQGVQLIDKTESADHQQRQR